MRPAAVSPFQAVERPYARGTAQPPPAIPGWLSPPRYWSRAVAVTLVLFAVIPMRVAELYPPLAHIKPAILASLFGFGLLWAYTSARGRRALWRDRQFQVALLFYAMALGSGLFALYKKAAFDGLQNLFFALIPLAAFLLVSPRAVQYEKLRRGMFIVATLYGLAVAAQGHVVEGSRLSTRGMFDPNDLCAVLVPMVALALASVTRGRMWERVMGAVAVGSLTYVIGQTASRGGFLGLVVAVLVFAAALDAKRTLVAMVAIVVGAIGLWQFGPEKFRERIGGMTEMNDDYNMTREEGRIQIWKRGLGYVADRPFLGVGINNMAEAEGRRLAQLGMHGKWWPAHNAFLQALVETGVLGGAVFVFMVAIAWRRAAALWRPGTRTAGVLRFSRPEVLAAIAGYYASVAFLSHAYSYMLYALLGFATFAWRCSQPAFNPEIAPSITSPAPTYVA